VLLLSVPLGNVTWTVPLAEADGTVAVICVDETIVKAAGMPLNVTPVASRGLDVAQAELRLTNA